MPNDPDLLTLARAVLDRKPAGSWDKTWDKHRTSPENLSQGKLPSGTAKSVANHRITPLSHCPMPQETGHWDKRLNLGQRLGLADPIGTFSLPFAPSAPS